jgi:hypothetical protein
MPTINVTRNGKMSTVSIIATPRVSRERDRRPDTGERKSTLSPPCIHRKLPLRSTPRDMLVARIGNAIYCPCPGAGASMPYRHRRSRA